MSRLSAETLKASVSPETYYRCELPGMPAPKKAGWNDGGLCPFHADQHRGNFRVNLESGAFTCFSCGAKGGDLIAFHMQRHSRDFLEALNEIAYQYMAGGLSTNEPRALTRGKSELHHAEYPKHPYSTDIPHTKGVVEYFC